jgi:4-amino-4-deoxy-L-arabinose transferase
MPSVPSATGGFRVAWTDTRPYAAVLLALLVAWSVGLFTRGFWSPDEPREANVSWRMSSQQQQAIPILAGAPIVEKPPLAYWLSGASIRAFGPGPVPTRLPNLAYALLATVLTGALARRLFGPAAVVPAIAFGGTFAMAFQVAIWLTTDAPLVASVALALLGAAQGVQAATPRARLAGYGLFHLGLAFAFLAKGPAGWMVPVLTLGGFLLAERRFGEFVRPELWAGALVPVAAVAAWTWSAMQVPGGAELLKITYWYNLVGRAIPLDVPPEVDYSSGHANWPGKYWVELPTYVYPWIGVLLAALVRTWRERGQVDAATRAGRRFALASCLLPLALMSVASTARGVYAAQALPGFALLFADWAVRQRQPDAAARRALRAAVVLVVLLGLVLGAAWFLAAPNAGGAAATPPVLAVALAGAGAAAVWLGAAWRRAPLVPAERTVALVAVAMCAVLAGPGYAAFAALAPAQDFATLGARVRAAAGGGRIVLYRPDETTRAFVDSYAQRDPVVVEASDPAVARARLRAALAAHPGARVLARLPGGEPGAVARRLGHRAAVPEPLAKDPGLVQAFDEAGLVLVAELGLPDGRRYGLAARRGE